MCVCYIPQKLVRSLTFSQAAETAASRDGGTGPVAAFQGAASTKGTHVVAKTGGAQHLIEGFLTEGSLAEEGNDAQESRSSSTGAAHGSSSSSSNIIIISSSSSTTTSSRSSTASRCRHVKIASSAVSRHSHQPPHSAAALCYAGSLLCRVLFDGGRRRRARAPGGGVGGYPRAAQPRP